MLPKCIYGKRRSGKTTKAIKECLKIGADLVVINQQNRQWILQESQFKKALEKINVFTHRQLLDGNLNGNKKPLVLDEVQFLLNSLSGGQIRAFTCSKPFTKKECKKLGLPLDTKY